MITTPSGMQILFDESPKKENLVIQDKAGSIFKMDSKTGDILIEAKGNVTINNGSQGAARQNDEVEVTIPKNSFIIKVTGGSGAAAVGVSNPTDIIVKGFIKSASGTVKIGD